MKKKNHFEGQDLKIQQQQIGNYLY